MDNKTKRLWIRLSPEEEKLFREKASTYQSMSAMVRDAVRQFDDIATTGKIEALNEMIALYKKYQQNLSWLGGNFNQAPLLGSYFSAIGIDVINNCFLCCQ
jgi:hypothetical protein